MSHQCSAKHVTLMGPQAAATRRIRRFFCSRWEAAEKNSASTTSRRKCEKIWPPKKLAEIWLPLQHSRNCHDEVTKIANTKNVPTWICRKAI